MADRRGQHWRHGQSDAEPHDAQHRKRLKREVQIEELTKGLVSRNSNDGSQVNVLCTTVSRYVVLQETDVPQAQARENTGRPPPPSPGLPSFSGTHGGPGNGASEPQVRLSYSSTSPTLPDDHSGFPTFSAGLRAPININHAGTVVIHYYNDPAPVTAKPVQVPSGEPTAPAEVTEPEKSQQGGSSSPVWLGPPSHWRRDTDADADSDTDKKVISAAKKKLLSPSMTTLLLDNDTRVAFSERLLEEHDLKIAFQKWDVRQQHYVPIPPEPAQEILRDIPDDKTIPFYYGTLVSPQMPSTWFRPSQDGQSTHDARPAPSYPAPVKKFEPNDLSNLSFTSNTSMDHDNSRLLGATAVDPATRTEQDRGSARSPSRDGDGESWKRQHSQTLA